MNADILAMSGKILAFTSVKRRRGLPIPTLALALLLCAASFTATLYGDRIAAFAVAMAERPVVTEPASGISRLSGSDSASVVAEREDPAGRDNASVFAARTMPVCGGGFRRNCVVDGDTVWIDREKFRIANIDAPELKSRCSREAGWARDAQRRLSVLLTGQTMTVRKSGTDVYGRTLAVISTLHGDVGQELVAERLAVRWTGHRADVSQWCGTRRS